MPNIDHGSVVTDRIQRECESLGLIYHPSINLQKLLLAEEDFNFLYRYVQSEQELYEDDDDMKPIVNIYQDSENPLELRMILRGSSFVFSDDDYKSLCAMISRGSKIITRKTGKNSLKIVICFDLN